jgi:hypothetical protein
MFDSHGTDGVLKVGLVTTVVWVSGWVGVEGWLGVRFTEVFVWTR